MRFSFKKSSVGLGLIACLLLLNSVPASASFFSKVIKADLAVTKVDTPDPVVAGQPLTYTIGVTNYGPDSATGVTIIDTLPLGVSFVSAAPSQGSCVPASGKVTCSLGTLSNGASATVTIVVIPASIGSLKNIASLLCVEYDPNSSNNKAYATTTVINPPVQVDLSIVKIDSPDPVILGQSLVYTVDISNSGPGNATGVVVTDTLPAGVTFVSAIPTQGNCVEAGGTVTCSLGDLASGNTATVLITVTPNAAGMITNSAGVTGNESDTDISNNTTPPVETTVLQPPSGADLSIIKTDSPDPVPAVGDNLTYTLTVTNQGPAMATNVSVTDALPATVTFMSATPSQGNCLETSGTVTCNLGELINGANAVVTIIVATGPPAGMIGNTAAVTGDQNDPDVTNNSATQNTNVGDTSRLINISSRAQVGTGANVEIAGFIVGGNIPKALMIRGRGPSLGGLPFQISGAMANPVLQIYSGQNLIAQNDDWQTTDSLCQSTGYACGGVSEIVATGLDPCQPYPGQSSAPSGCTQESVVLITLPPGLYTAILQGVSGQTGVGLVEVFDPDITTLPKLTNISTRAEVLTGASVMIGGFIVGAGTGEKTVLIRARGPSLSGEPFNILGTLTNPTLELRSDHDQDSLTPQIIITQNNDWQTTDSLCLSPAVSCGDAAQITTTGIDPCVPNPGQMVSPPDCGNEAAILVTLPPGLYTAIVRGVGGTTGVGLVEVIELSP